MGGIVYYTKAFCKFGGYVGAGACSRFTESGGVAEWWLHPVRRTEMLMRKWITMSAAAVLARDVAGILKFCKSTSGQKVIAEMRRAMAAGMKIGRPWCEQAISPAASVH